MYQFRHGHINRMINRKDRSTIFNAEHGFLDIIYVRLQRRRLTKKLGNERRSRLHVTCGRVLLARAQMCNNLQLRFVILFPEFVVGRTEATDVEIHNALAHYGRDLCVRFGVPPAHSAACDYFRHDFRLELVHNASRFVGQGKQSQGVSGLYLPESFCTRRRSGSTCGLRRRSPALDRGLTVCRTFSGTLS